MIISKRLNKSNGYHKQKKAKRNCRSCCYFEGYLRSFEKLSMQGRERGSQVPLRRIKTMLKSLSRADQKQQMWGKCLMQRGDRENQK